MIEKNRNITKKSLKLECLQKKMINSKHAKFSLHISVESRIVSQMQFKPLTWVIDLGGLKSEVVQGQSAQSCGVDSHVVTHISRQVGHSTYQ